MVDFTKSAPGVYIKEVTPTGPIAGTGTSTPAFIGTVKTLDEADAGTPVAVTNWTAFTDRFGDYDKTKTLPFAVRGYFENGGTFAYIVAIADLAGLDGALTSLKAFTDVSMVCLPTVVDPNPQKKVIAHCEEMADRVAILDGAQDQEPLSASGALQKQKKALLSKSGFAALYWPWIQIPDPTVPPDTPALVSTAPSGHIAGVLARSDSQRGVHKAPANEPVIGASGLDYILDNTQHGVLNDLNINALRVFPGRSQPMVWGARTLTDGIPWRHLNVRRLMCFIEDSIVAGTSWALFEPNSIALWKRLELSISEFLTRVWQSGALFGATADQAFYVKIDQELNPPSTRALGQVFGEIGVAPVHPAEYVVFRIGMWDGGAQVTET
jgi:phage tail sheath protein FI